MIIGLSLRHYKIYNNINFIPVSNDSKNRLSLFIGNNGVGKSSVLEALNTFFNNGYWNRSKSEKQDQTFICPIFLIEKDKFNLYFNLNEDDISVLNIISNFLFNLEETNSKEFKEFVKIRNNMSITAEKYYILIVGNTYKERNKTYFGSSFDNEIRTSITNNFAQYNIDKILANIKSYYSYIYIPVESKTDDVLKLEANEMQKLMNRNILETIENVLTEKRIKPKNKNANISLVSLINTTLNNFMDGINSQIKLIDEDYSFKVEDGYKKNLTATDLREQILRAYFSIRTLKKSGKEIFELSSGEQRIALIDIATAFIKNNANSQGEVILAIDEPEASLHISKCFNQFKRIENLAFREGTQIMLTTHWYGSIPTLQNGTLNHIQIGSKVDINSFSLNNYLEQRRDFPDDIDLKSFFELVSTIISSIKSDKTKWLIVEGSDDYLYYKKYVLPKVENLVILPVGGCGNVIKVYEYLFAPFSEKVEKGILKNSKVMCLIDSDVNQKTTKLSNSQIDNSLKICRIQNFNDENTLQNLINVGNYYPTIIEDCLNPSLFYNALQKTLKEDNSEIYSIFEKFELNESFNNSRLNGEISLLKPKTIEAMDQKQILITRINESDFKMQLAENYYSIDDIPKSKTPGIFLEVIKFLNGK